MARRLLFALAALLLVALVAGGGLLGWAWATLHRPLQASPQGEAEVEIREGEGARSILKKLEAQRIVANATLARLYLVYVLDDPPLKAGEYRFGGPITTPEVLAKLSRGEVVTYPVTLIEGLTLGESADHLAKAGFGDRQALLQAMTRPEAIADLDPEAENLEGYLFPDTYTFARGTPEEKVVATLVRTFRRHVDAEIQPLAGDMGEGELRSLVSLASIIEKEARLAEERPLIAGVFANRLRIGMALAADPTIIYALKQEGTWDGNIRRRDLKLDSPYNTYLYPGLPPGPICSPGLASLRAAAAPADVPFLYFVSRNDGSHAFAATLAEHNRNVERWQKRYWRERWARDRR